MVTALTTAQVDRLAAASFTYDDAGATASSSAPAGYRTFAVRMEVEGLDLDLAAERLLSWEVHEQAGLRVAASSPRVAEGVVVQMRLGSLRIPCRVVYVVDEPDRRGFAYGTLPGHPESGEELFLIERSASGVILTVRAFSRPSTRLARLAGPAGRWFQDVMTRRYLRALRGHTHAH